MTKPLVRRALPLLCALFLASGAAAAQAEAGQAGHAPASEAIVSAQSRIAAEGYSPARLLALGRAQLAAGEPGAAITSFERGKLLAPRSTALNEALQEARALAGVAPPEESAASLLSQRLSLREWSTLNLVAACVSALLLILLALLHRRRLVAALFGAAIVAFALTGAGAWLSREGLARAVVVQPDAVLQKSPIANAETVRSLRAGELVTLSGQRHAAFVYVTLPAGQSGWLARSAFARLAAPANSGS